MVGSSKAEPSAGAAAATNKKTKKNAGSAALAKVPKMANDRR